MPSIVGELLGAVSVVVGDWVMVVLAAVVDVVLEGSSVGVPITQYDLLVSRFGTGDSGVQLLESADRDGPAASKARAYP
jgi:hypothetical protein